MKAKTLTIALLITLGMQANTHAQSIIDTIAIQDFELVPASPVLGFTGPVIYNSNAYSSSSAAPPNSPIGIGGSRAWETTTNSSGLTLIFNNTLISSVYDTVYARFRLAAMNLNSSTGGPDDLDWVQFSYSTDGGLTYTNRIRIKGAVTGNSFWPYSATAVARLYYTPTTEISFQPSASGLQTTEGYSTCEIVFPGNITQLQLKITARSSSSSDTWLIDNIVLLGKKSCSNTFATQTEFACASYQWPVNGVTYTNSGTYIDTIPNSTGCDSIISLNLSIKNHSFATQNKVACSSYFWPLNGMTYHSSGTYTDTIANAADCDSIVTLNLTLSSIDTTVSQVGITLSANQTGASYQWLNCNSGMQPIPGAVFKIFTPQANGSYAVAITVDSCTKVSSCKIVNSVGIDTDPSNPELVIYPNPNQGFLTIMNAKSIIGAHYRLVDLPGHTLFTGTIDSDLTSIDLSVVNDGLYLLIIESGNSSVFKIVKRAL